MGIFSKDLGVDLGTANVVINISGSEELVNEPSVVAMDRNNGRIIRVGREAKNMLDRTPGNLVAMHPLKDGVISDHEMTVKLLQAMFKNADDSKLLKPKPRVVIGVPSSVTQVEERSVINAALEAGARRVYLVESPLVAALGAGLDISRAEGRMVVDIGAGTTDVAVLTMNAIAGSSSINIAGNAFDAAIVREVRHRYNMIIGMQTARDIKEKIGWAIPHEEEEPMTIAGLDVQTRIIKEQKISSYDFVKVFGDLARQIGAEVQALLESTSPELVSDVAATGITLTGGSSAMKGLAQAITERTGIICTIADQPDLCVAKGFSVILDKWLRNMREGTINTARRRAMRK